MYNTHDGPVEGARVSGRRWQAGPAYVRCAIYDVRFGEFPRLRANSADYGGAWNAALRLGVPALAREFGGGHLSS